MPVCVADEHKTDIFDQFHPFSLVIQVIHMFSTHHQPRTEHSEIHYTEHSDIHMTATCLCCVAHRLLASFCCTVCFQEDFGTRCQAPLAS